VIEGNLGTEVASGDILRCIDDGGLRPVEAIPGGTTDSKGAEDVDERDTEGTIGVGTGSGRSMRLVVVDEFDDSFLIKEGGAGGAG
jgi:hypothetical protein